MNPILERVTHQRDVIFLRQVFHRQLQFSSEQVGGTILKYPLKIPPRRNRRIGGIFGALKTPHDPYKGVFRCQTHCAYLKHRATTFSSHLTNVKICFVNEILCDLNVFPAAIFSLKTTSYVVLDAKNRIYIEKRPQRRFFVHLPALVLPIHHVK